MKIVNGIGFMLVAVLTTPFLFLGHVLNLFGYSDALQITFNPSKGCIDLKKIK